MRLKPVSGAFGHEPKDTRPELHVRHDDDPNFRREERKPFVPLADNKELAEVGVEITAAVVEAGKKTRAELIRDQLRQIRRIKADIAAVHSLRAELARGGVISDPDKCKDSNDLERQLQIFRKSLVHEQAILALLASGK